MTAFDHPRSDWNVDQADVVLSSTGSRRPLLATPLQVFTVHYGGAGTQWLDHGDTHVEMMNIEHYARAEGKPNEYNSVSDIDSETWEYSGPYQAAHNGNGNPIEWGHLALYGLEELTDDQAAKLIAGIRRARRQAVDAGYLTPDHIVEPHAIRRPLMNPGKGGTACPGPLWTNKTWWNAITAPLTDEETPTMPRTYIQLPPEGREGHPHFFIEGGAARVATGFDNDPTIERFRDIDDEAVERYDLMHESIIGRRP
jgi:hypothetical protein